MNGHAVGKPGCLDRRNFTPQHLVQGGIFIAEIEVGVLDPDGVTGDQDAFQHPVRPGLEAEAVLEGAGFALVGVDGHHAGARHPGHDAPLAPRGETGTAEASQAAVLQRRDDVLAVTCAGLQGPQDPVAAVRFVFRQRLVGGQGRIVMLTGGAHHRCGVCMKHLCMSDSGDRRAVAGAHAGRAENPDILARGGFQFRLQHGCARHLAGDAVADTDGDRRGRGLVLAHHVEMGVEGRRLVDFRHRQAHQFGEGGEMGGREAAGRVLDHVQMLDQQIAVQLPPAEQRADFRE